MDQKKIRSRLLITIPLLGLGAVLTQLDFNVLFNNSGMDSTIVRDVSDQIRNQCRGGIITIEIDVDQMNIPTRTGGSGFDAVVKDTEDGGTYEFDM